MAKFEDNLKKYAIYSPDEITKAPIEEIFSNIELTKLSQGIQARAFKVKGSDWVVKEGRWDLDLSFLFGKSNIPFPARMMQRIMQLFAFTFLPDKKEISRQYAMYLKFVQYFGFFRTDSIYHHRDRELLFTSQKNIRDSLPVFRKDIEKKYKIKLDSKIDRILTSKYKYHNFLPQEYLLYGKSISPENKGEDTYFIVQKFIQGQLLHDIPEDDLTDDTYYQLIIMIYMILVMHMREHLLPDTRPRYPLAESHNWLTKTDNVIVSKKRITFIDTRWFWDTRDNIIKRGAIIPIQIIRLSKYFLETLLDNVE